MSSNCATSILCLFFIATLCSGGCMESERHALLQFKNGLSDPSNRLSDWVTNESDCCRWTGVVCHNITFHVLELHLRPLSQSEYFGLGNRSILSDDERENVTNSVLSGKVSDSLLELKRLSYLDLSLNDFGGVPIPKFIGSLQNLRYLELSRAGFGGMIPPQLGNLSNLHYLNLQASNYGSLYVENLDWISSLSSLEFLDMSYVNLNRSFDWLRVINSLHSLLELKLSLCRLPILNPASLLTNLNMSSSLLVLDLSFNYFGGPIPNGLQNITSPFLRELDLFGCNFSSSIPNWFYDLTHLQLLLLRGNQFEGRISSDGIGNLTSLVSLDISFNYNELEFDKGIPTSFRNFCNLRSLILSGVKLNQKINDVLAIMSGCVSNVLEYLALQQCQLSGHLTDDLGSFKKLFYFYMDDNLISGPIPLSFGELNSLKYLNLGNNRLNGSLPESFGNLKELEIVYIDYNNLEGEVSDPHFANLTRLSYFVASGNNIALRVSSNWIPPVQLEELGLRSWHIGSQFPNWLGLLKHLRNLDLSNTGISTPFPIWFQDLFSNYGYLNVSHNQIHGSIPNLSFVNGNLWLIDLSSNNFSGPIPYFSSNVTALDLSNNSFSGSISHFLCSNINETKLMQVLNLERNFLHGEIPDCWRSWENLSSVKLSNNKFTGNIPNTIGTLRLLQTLHLRNNNLYGEIPMPIQNCAKLALLDFSENNFAGSIPTWIGDGFVDLSILSLRENKFDGYLPKQLCRLVSLRILDLARNKFLGAIPSCFGNFTGMATRHDSGGSFYTNIRFASFMETGLLVMKGKVMEYSTILRFVRSIDLSDNNLSGEIPEELTTLAELLSLNLSHNSLSGRIPPGIGDMERLNSIDFSHNQLSGEIPPSMSSLGSLGMLDLSYNNLTGRIPPGTKLQGFDSSNFTGNQLCGLPLIVNCTGDGTWFDSEKQPDGDEDEDETDHWFYISMAYGFGVGFWTAVGSLIFIKRWRHFYFGLLHNLWQKILWSCYCRHF
ncbi:Receptor-like protein EIX2 [Euphorbia peplus]|nr:Receptor-like protein EIX2 [Euphorbia peplus]